MLHLNSMLTIARTALSAKKKSKMRADTRVYRVDTDNLVAGHLRASPTNSRWQNVKRKNTTATGLLSLSLWCARAFPNIVVSSDTARNAILASAARSQE